MKEINIGPYQYIADDNWATGPDNFTWGETASVATDSQDNVYVYSRTDRPLMIFEKIRKNIWNFRLKSKFL